MLSLYFILRASIYHCSSENTSVTCSGLYFLIKKMGLKLVNHVFYEAFILCTYYILECINFSLSLKQYNEHFIMGFDCITYEYIEYSDTIIC